MIRKHKPFTSLSRRQRRAKTLRIKHLIHRERERCGGLHYDDCVTPVSMLGNIWSWADVLFLGNAPDVYWNALILTTADEQQSIIEQMAMDEAFALLDAEEREEEGRFETTPDFDAKGKVISHTLVQRTRLTYSQFDELTFNAFVDKRIAEITRDNPPAVQAGYKILPGYAAGIGLQIIVSEPVLTRAIIDNAIRSFLAGDIPLIT